MDARTSEAASPGPFPTVRGVLRLLFALAFAFAGYKHVAAPDGFVAITPGWVPRPAFAVWATGWCEIAGAAGLVVPLRWSTAAYRTASIALAVYALCVWPANFNHALHDIPIAGVHLSWWYHGPRLAFQPVLIWALLWAGDVIDWPFARPRR
ncbi:DoxX family protein [Novosphingobium kaempferiae]|uniref:DoxX family protein n=1 Tax=Novosphingobium kaempferiae TaxID=2896849 RepID=UPI001E4A0E7E|nr:DoxX family protein [Novosphingobium kaempferiae]